MLQLVDITKNFGGRRIFDALSWHVDQYARVALVGPNGAGKTTLLNILSGDLEPDSGRIVIPGRTRIGYLAQEVGAFEATTVVAEVESGRADLVEAAERIDVLQAALSAGNHDVAEELGDVQSRFELAGGYRFRAEAREILGHLGFDTEEMDKPPQTFSGGWRMRIMLGKLLLQRPELLLLDEPTNHLDLETLEWLEGFLDAYPGCVVVVSHDRAFLNRFALAIAALDEGDVRVFPGNYDAFTAAIDAEAELLEKHAELQARKVAEIERFIERFRAKATKAKQVQSRVKMLEKMSAVETRGSQKTVSFKLPEAKRSGKLVAQLDAVRKAYGDNVVYRALDFQAWRGERIALVGPNGAGKSTLLKILAGTIDIDGGEFTLGSSVERGYFAQHQAEQLDVEKTVLGTMLAQAEDHSMTRIRGILGTFLFAEDDVEKPVRVLSGGEKNRLALARMLMGQPNFVLMDEPTNHLDMASRDALEDALQGFGGCLVIISHDRYFINELATRVVHVEHGTVTDYPGNYDDYLAARKRAREAGVLPQRGGERSDAADDAESGGSRKARRKALAEIRSRRKAATGALRKRVDKLESSITDLEARLEAVETQLADPAIYADGGARVEGLASERGDVSTELEAAMDAWSEAQAELEEADAVFDAEEAEVNAR